MGSHEQISVECERFNQSTLAVALKTNPIRLLWLYCLRPGIRQ